MKKLILKTKQITLKMKKLATLKIRKKLFMSTLHHCLQHLRNSADPTDWQRKLRSRGSREPCRMFSTSYSDISTASLSTAPARSAGSGTGSSGRRCGAARRGGGRWRRGCSTTGFPPSRGYVRWFTPGNPSISKLILCFTFNISIWLLLRISSS